MKHESHCDCARYPFGTKIVTVIGRDIYANRPCVDVRPKYCTCGALGVKTDPAGSRPQPPTP